MRHTCRLHGALRPSPESRGACQGRPLRRAVASEGVLPAPLACPHPSPAGTTGTAAPPQPASRLSRRRLSRPTFPQLGGSYLVLASPVRLRRCSSAPAGNTGALLARPARRGEARLRSPPPPQRLSAIRLSWAPALKRLWRPGGREGGRGGFGEVLASLATQSSGDGGQRLRAGAAGGSRWCAAQAGLRFLHRVLPPAGRALLGAGCGGYGGSESPSPHPCRPADELCSRGWFEKMSQYSGTQSRGAGVKLLSDNYLWSPAAQREAARPGGSCRTRSGNSASRCKWSVLSPPEPLLRPQACWDHDFPVDCSCLLPVWWNRSNPRALPAIYFSTEVGLNVLDRPISVFSLFEGLLCTLGFVSTKLSFSLNVLVNQAEERLFGTWASEISGITSLLQSLMLVFYALLIHLRGSWSSQDEPHCLASANGMSSSWSSFRVFWV